MLTLHSLGNGDSQFNLLVDSGNYLISLSGAPKKSFEYEISDVIFSTTSNSNYVTASTIPEPSNIALMLAGLGLIGFLARRKNKI